MSELSELDLLLSMSPSNDWLSDSSDGLDSLFGDLDHNLWDLSYDPYIPPPLVPKNKEPPVANQSGPESPSELQTNAIPVPALDRTSTPNEAGGTSSSLLPTSTIGQPIHEPSVQPAPAPLKRKRQSEGTKAEGRPEKKKNGKRSLKTGSTEGGSSVPSKERSARRRRKHSAYYAGLDLLLDQFSLQYFYGRIVSNCKWEFPCVTDQREEDITSFELTVKQRNYVRVLREVLWRHGNFSQGKGPMDEIA